MKKPIFFFVFLFVQISLYSQTMEIMTYNIKYANENDGENSWSNRKEFITNQLKFYEPDAFGVQEAVKQQMDYFKDHLDGYDYVGVGRDDGKEGGEYSAIFYKKSRLKVLKHDTFWLSETPQKPSKGWDAAYPRICTYALFEDQQTGEKFWYFNTHFDHIGDKARKESAKLIWKKIQELNSEDLPAILSGDFNLEPDTESIRYLSEKMDDSKAISEGVVFGPEGTFNGYEFDKPVTRRIDYIFLSHEDFKVLKFGVISSSKDLRYPSDHLPVMVKLELKK
ncbi:MAG: endonuclease/exonuclease/phosphatase family protein [Salegentibacter sp.]